MRGGKDDGVAAHGGRIFEDAVTAAGDLARRGWRLSLLPALVLPQSLRAPLFSGIRWWTEGFAGALPPPLARTADGFAADLDDLEAGAARREDLGSRLRRERRRARRGE